MKKRLIQGTLRGSFDLCVVLAALLGALFCFLDLVEAPVDKQAIGFCADRKSTRLNSSHDN